MAPVSATTHLREQFPLILSGDAWYGLPVLSILKDIDTETALACPIKGAHNIWEILIHMTVWTDIVRGRLDGISFIPSPEQDWPPVTDSSELAWHSTVREFKVAWETLIQKIETLTDEQIETTTVLNIESSNKPFSVSTLLHGIIQHTTYHAGQIALLKKGGP